MKKNVVMPYNLLYSLKDLEISQIRFLIALLEELDKERKKEKYNIPLKSIVSKHQGGVGAPYKNFRKSFLNFFTKGIFFNEKRIKLFESFSQPKNSRDIQVVLSKQGSEFLNFTKNNYILFDKKDVVELNSKKRMILYLAFSTFHKKRKVALTYTFFRKILGTSYKKDILIKHNIIIPFINFLDSKKDRKLIVSIDEPLLNGSATYGFKFNVFRKKKQVKKNDNIKNSNDFLEKNLQVLVREFNFSVIQGKNLLKSLLEKNVDQKDISKTFYYIRTNKDSIKNLGGYTYTTFVKKFSL